MKGKSYSSSHQLLFSKSVIPLTTGLSNFRKLVRAYAQYTFLFVHLGMVGALLAAVIWCLSTANLTTASSSSLADLPRLIVEEVLIKWKKFPLYMASLVATGGIIVFVCALVRYVGSFARSIRGKQDSAIGTNEY